MPIPSHELLIQHLKNLGYEFNPAGVCAGLTQMGIQAFLLGEAEFKTFCERLKLIARTPNLAKKIAKVKKKIIVHQKKIPRSIPIHLTKKDKQLLEVLAFFDSLILYQEPDTHRKWFGKKVLQSSIDEIFPFTIPTLMKKAKDSIEIVDSISGIYSIVELENYFGKLNEILNSHIPPTDFVMGIESISHRVSLCFDSKHKIWMMIDANNLPPTAFQVKKDQFAPAIFLVLKAGRDTDNAFMAFNTKIYSRRNNRAEIKKIMNNLKNSAEFIQAHEITLERAYRTSILDSTLMKIAAKNNDKITLEKLLNLYLDSPDPKSKYFLKILTEVIGKYEYCNYENLLPILAHEKQSLVPLFIDSIKANNIDRVEALINIQGDLWLEQHNGINVALKTAIQNNNIEMLNYVMAQIPVTIPIESLIQLDNLGYNILHYAACLSPSQILARLLQEEIDVDSQDKYHQTMLHMAAVSGLTKNIQVLIDHHANLTLENSYGKSAIQLAAENNHSEALNLLLKNISSKYFHKLLIQKKILFNAIQADHVKIVNKLLIKCIKADRNLLNIKYNDNSTLAHFAVVHNSIETLKLLDKHGADLYFKNDTYETPLDLAQDNVNIKIFYQAIELRRKLIVATNIFDLGSDYLSTLKKLIINESRKNPKTFVIHYSNLSSEAALLFFAIEKNNVNALKFLIQSGLKLTILNHEYISPIHLAIRLNHTDCVKILLKEDIHSLENAVENVPLVCTIANEGSIDVLNILNKNVDWNAADSLGFTPLHIATINGFLPIIKKLATHKVDFEKTANAGQTALHFAVQKGDVAVLKFLLKQNVSVIDKEAVNGMTPLMLAIKYDNIEIASILIRYGAAINKANSDGLTPSHIAVREERCGALELLFAYGANLECIATKEPYKGKKPRDFLTEQSKAHSFFQTLELRQTLLKAAEKLVFNKTNNNVFIKLQNAISLAKSTFLLEILEKESTPDLSAFIVQSRGLIYYISDFIKLGIKFNEPNKMGLLPIHLMAKSNLPFKVRILSDIKDIDINATVDKWKEKSGWAAIHFAAEQGNSGIIAVLADKKADLDKTLPDGSTALFLAAKENKLKTVELLLHYQPNLLDKPNLAKITPLMIAIQNGHDEIISALMIRNAKFDVHNKEGLTAIHLAAKKNNIKLLQTFDLMGADLNIPTEGLRSGKKPVDFVVQTSEAAIYLQAYALRKIILQELNQFEFDEVVKEKLAMDVIKKSREAPQLFLSQYQTISSFSALLFIAIENNNSRALDLLLQSDIQTIDALPENSLMPIHLAIQLNQIDCLKVLVDTKKPAINDLKKIVERGSPKGTMSAIHFAGNNKSLDIIKFLADRKVDFSQETAEGKTALDLALENKQIDALKCMLKYAPWYVNKRDKNGDTPLLALIKKGDPQYLHEAKILIENGADLHAKDKNGLTLTQYALEIDSIADSINCLNILEQLGVDLRSPFIEGQYRGKKPIEVASPDKIFFFETIELKNKLLNAIDQLILPNSKENLQKLNHLKFMINITDPLHPQFQLLKTIPSPEEALLFFVTTLHNDVSMYPLLLKAGIKFNIPHPTGLLPLQLVVQQQNIADFKAILALKDLQDIELDKAVAKKDSVHEGWSAIHFAILSDHNKFIEILIQANMDVTKKLPDGSTPLMLAVIHGIVSTVEYLLKNNPAEVNIANNLGATALHISAQNGSTQFITLLADHNADFDQKTIKGETAVFLAAKSGHIDALKLLLTYKPSLLNIANKNHVTPLMIAAAKGYTEIVTELLKNGADLNAVNSAGFTALHLAIENNELSSLKILDEYGASLELKPLEITKISVEMSDYFQAATRRKLLLAAIDDLSIKNSSITHFKNLISEVSRNNPKQFLDEYESLNPHAALLFFAIEQRTAKIFKLLLEAGLQSDCVNAEGYELLYLAAMQGQTSIIICLDEKKLDLTRIFHPENYTLAFIAAKNAHLPLLKWLIDHYPVLLDRPSENNMTPLMVAIETGNIDIVKELISSKANLNLLNSEGLSALHLAAQNNQLDILIALDKAKANMDVPSDLIGMNDTTKKYLEKIKWRNSLFNVLDQLIFIEPEHTQIINQFKKQLIDLSETKTLDEFLLNYPSLTPRESLIFLTQYLNRSELLLPLVAAGLSFKVSSLDCTILHAAVLANQIDYVKKLVELEIININQVDGLGNAACHYAAEKGCIEITKLLWDKKADFHLQRKNGLTPIALAEKNDHVGLAKLIQNISRTAFSTQLVTSTTSALFSEKNIKKDSPIKSEDRKEFKPLS